MDEIEKNEVQRTSGWFRPWTRMCIIHSSSPGLSMQLQVGLISCAAVTRGKKPLPLLVKYIESR